MISLEEKRERQRKIINELFKYIGDEIYHSEEFIQDKLREIFKVEMDYYGIKALQDNEDDDEIVLDFEYNSKDTTSYFGENVNIGFDGWYHYDYPRIVLNTASREYKEMFSSNSYKRCNGLCSLLLSLFHEMRHKRQVSMMRSDISNPFNLRYAKEEICLHENHILIEMNHDRLSVETDADIFSYTEGSEFLELDENDVKYIDIVREMKESELLIVPNYGIVSRDFFMDLYAEFLIAHSRRSLYTGYYTILNKEFKKNGSPRRLGELIRNYKRELKEVEKKDIDAESKKTLISDIKAMYYSLFIKKVIQKNPFEIYEAVRLNGNDTVTEILHELKVYNIHERKRKADSIRNKLKLRLSLGEEKEEYNLAQGNMGYIIDKESGQICEVDDYIRSLFIDIPYTDAYELSGNADFLLNLPVQGHYILKNGSKISVKDFLNEYAFPNLKGQSTESMLERYNKIVKEFTKPQFENDALTNYEINNRQYQDLNRKIDEILNSRIVKDSKYVKIIASSYSKKLLSYYEMVKKFCKGEPRVINYFDGKPFVIPVKPYKKFFPDQKIKINELLSAAMMLTHDNIFNPGGINYHQMLSNNEQFKIIVNQLKEYDESVSKGLIKE